MMHDEFIENETWYFTETKGNIIRSYYPQVDENTMDFILDKYCGLHIMHLVASISELRRYFEDMFSKEVADTKIARSLYRGSVLYSKDGMLKILVREPNETAY